MKKRINIMLSEEAVLRADESGNRSEYIENLIMGNNKPSMQVVPFMDMLEVVEERLGSLLRDLSPPQNKKLLENIKPTFSSPTARNVRTPKDVLQDIRELEAEVREKLEYAQDPEFIKQTEEQAKLGTDVLWKEYHELTRQEELHN